MSEKAVVQIVGVPIACSEGYKDAWREVASWVANQLVKRFGDFVQVNYFDLFEPDCPPLPEGAQLPLVLVNGQVVSSGGKISIPAIRRYIEDMGFVAVRGIDQTAR